MNHWNNYKERFEKQIKINEETKCWEWIGTRDRKNYGQFTYNGTRLAHRAAYQLYIGEIPDGMLVCHHCDNPPCVNPEHLFLGTHKDNTQDCIKKERFCFRDKNEHPSIAHYKKGCRCEDCVFLNSEYHKKWYAEHKELCAKWGKEYREKNIDIIRDKDRERNKLRRKK